MSSDVKVTRRRYTAAEKASAIARAEKEGPSAAAKELGIPVKSLANWRARDRASGPRVKAAVGAEPTPAPPESAKAQPKPPAATGGSPSTRRARVAKVYTPSQIAQALERVEEIGVRPAAAELHISRTTLREWGRKVTKAAKGEGQSPTSGPDPKSVEADRDRRILGEWNKQRGLGPSQIKNQLRREGFRVSTQTVRRVMEDNGYLPPKTQRRDHTGLYEAVRPNQMWHLDFVHRHIHKQPVFVLALIDDHSRFVTGWALDDAERADAVITAFEGAVARHGKPEAVMHDGGSAFWSWKGASRFSRILDEYGVDQVKVDVPQTNGKIEVFNANLHKELFDRITFEDVGELRRRIGPHFAWFNNHRTHHALGGLLVPADRYFGRADEVTARIENGGSAGDPLDLAGRTLDLLRVVSHRGKPEVWLMGHKILDLGP